MTNAIYEAGFNSASQVYGNVHAILGMTPAESRNGGKDVEITYSIVDSALGGVLIAATSRGICRVDIATTPAELEDGLRSTFPRAKLERADDRLESSASLIVAYLCGGTRGRACPWTCAPVHFKRACGTRCATFCREPHSAMRSSPRPLDRRPGTRRCTGLRDQSDCAAHPVPPHRSVGGRRRRSSAGDRSANENSSTSSAPARHVLSGPLLKGADAQAV